ncbi:MAG: hypothetical protein R2883_03450 [Caldisericia bacterium]
MIIKYHFLKHLSLFLCLVILFSGCTTKTLPENTNPSTIKPFSTSFAEALKTPGFIFHVIRGIAVSENIKNLERNPITEEMAQRFNTNWNDGFEYNPDDFPMIAGFWASVASSKLDLDLPVKSIPGYWEKEVSLSDVALTSLGIWIWESREGRTNGTPASNDTKSLPQNNAMDVFSYHIDFMNGEYEYAFDNQRLGNFEGLGVGVSWVTVLLSQVKSSLVHPDEKLTLRDLAVSLYLYNPSCREGTGFEQCRHGQFWRDNFTHAFGVCDDIWYYYGLDSKAEQIRNSHGWNHPDISLKDKNRYNLELIEKPLDE